MLPLSVHIVSGQRPHVGKSTGSLSQLCDKQSAFDEASEGTNCCVSRVIARGPYSQFHVACGKYIYTPQQEGFLSMKKKKTVYPGWVVVHFPPYHTVQNVLLKKCTCIYILFTSYQDF